MIQDIFVKVDMSLCWECTSVVAKLMAHSDRRNLFIAYDRFGLAGDVRHFPFARLHRHVRAFRHRQRLPLAPRRRHRIAVVVCERRRLLHGRWWHVLVDGGRWTRLNLGRLKTRQLREFRWNKKQSSLNESDALRYLRLHVNNAPTLSS